MSRLSLQDYARQKGFDPAWLRELFVEDTPQGLGMLYLDEEERVQALRLRHGEGAPSRFSWHKGHEPLPYGLWLPLNRWAEGMVLCEGESDAQSMWMMGLPCLGIPGAASFKARWASWYVRERPIWLHVEPDQGGQTFLSRTLSALREGGIQAPVYRFSCAQIDPGCKDISDLYVKLGAEAARLAIRRELARKQPAELDLARPGAGERGQGPQTASDGRGGIEAAGEMPRSEPERLPAPEPVGAVDGVAGDSAAQALVAVPGAMKEDNAAAPGMTPQAGDACDPGLKATQVMNTGLGLGSRIGMPGAVKEENAAVPGFTPQAVETYQPGLNATQPINTDSGLGADAAIPGAGNDKNAPAPGMTPQAVETYQPGPTPAQPPSLPPAAQPERLPDAPAMPSASIREPLREPQDELMERPSAALPAAGSAHPGITPPPQGSAAAPTQSSPAVAPARREAGEPLGAYQASDLWGAQLPRPLMVLDGTLTAGLCMLAGAPKKGKSWLALALALAVAEGQPLMSRPTRQGEVLYLDLESRQYRVQERLSLLRPGPPPQGLYISHHAPRLSEGLIGQLEAWMRGHPQTALIIIDTLARVKSPGAGGENVYEADTRLMGELQRFALDHGLCLLLIHHLRKSSGGFKETDVYERISGSTGLTGVCDCVLVLEGRRQESEAALHVDGRDIPAKQLALGFDAGRWTLLSEDGEAYRQGSAYESSPLPAALGRLMQGREKWEGTASELCEALDEASAGGVDCKSETLYQAIAALMPRLTQQEGISAQRLRIRGNRVIRLRKDKASESPPSRMDIAPPSSSGML